MDLYSEVHASSAPQTRASSDAVVSRQIGIVLFDGFALSEAATVIEVFKSANALAESTRQGGTHYDVCLLSGAGGGIASSSSVFVWTESVEARRRFHGIFVIGGEGVQYALRDERLLNWLRCTYPSSELISSTGDGRLLLEAARSGQAVASRAYGEPIRAVMRNAPDSDAAASPLRTALNLVKADLGIEVARQIVDWVTPPVEAQFTSIVPTNTSARISEKIQASVQWLQANGDRPIAIDQAAQVAAMSERNFLRRFKLEVGVTPSDYLLYVRLDMSCRLLVKTDLPVDKIARRCGIGCGGRLSKLFRKHLSTTPTEYRESQRGSAPIALTIPQEIRLF